MKNVKYKNKLKFIDLFSGIGGFHQMMKKFNGEFVLASEIDPHAINTYDKNYLKNSKQTSAVDITTINEKDIPDFDVLCAGFPCQTFSKAGKREGFEDETRGTLFFDIARILKEKQPKYILLENVRNLVSHDSGNTWETIKQTLVSLGYVISQNPIIISPHNLKIPQLRERVFIPGYIDKSKAGKVWLDINVPKVDKNSVSPLKIINDKNDADQTLALSSYETMVLDTWDKFYKGIDKKILGFPIWASIFSSNYVVEKAIPKWKKIIIDKNILLYENNKKFIDRWIKETGILTPKFTNTHRKMEWQAGDSIKSLYEGIIQFRPSGVRVKRPTVFPTLVAMVQTPIIGWKKRYLAVSEAASLQSFPKTFKVDDRQQQAYKQFGNSINVKTAEYIFEQLIEKSKK